MVNVLSLCVEFFTSKTKNYGKVLLYVLYVYNFHLSRHVLQRTHTHTHRFDKSFNEIDINNSFLSNVCYIFILHHSPPHYSFGHFFMFIFRHSCVLPFRCDRVDQDRWIEKGSICIIFNIWKCFSWHTLMPMTTVYKGM